MGFIFDTAATVVEVNSNMGQHQYAQQELWENRKLAQRAGLEAIELGNVEAGKQRMKGAFLQGEQKVAYANSGVDPTTGSAAQMQGETAMLTALDAKVTENNAAREAWGYKQQAAKFKRQSAQEEEDFHNKQWATALSGASKFVSGAMSMQSFG